MPHRHFATALTCIDGRIQAPLHEWVTSRLGVDYVDVVTEPGPDRTLSSATRLDALVSKVRVSQRAHASTTLVLAGHEDCAGNPVPAHEHRRQLGDAVHRLAALLPRTRIIAVYLARCAEDACWQPCVVADTGPVPVRLRPERYSPAPAGTQHSATRAPDGPPWGAPASAGGFVHEECAGESG